MNQKVLLLSPHGFIGSAIERNWRLTNMPLITLSRNDLDFRNSSDLTSLLREINPSIVINAAGRVAGIQGNIDNPADLLMLNVEVSTSVLRACHEANIPRLIQFASACVYPVNEFGPSKTCEIGGGHIEDTSLGYASAKILAIEAVRAIRKQYGRDWLTLIPTNLYGTGDWGHGTSGHVISMLLEKFVNAKKLGSSSVTVWGDGKSKRNFLHVDDLSSAVEFIVSSSQIDQPIVNLSGDLEIEVTELAFLIREITGFGGEILFDTSKPNGARRKQLDDSYLRNMGWMPNTQLKEGITQYLKDYLERN